MYEQNGVATEVYTLQRIAPILSVGCYFEASCPTNGTLVTLVWWCITFRSILTKSPRKMLVSWSRTGKLWSIQTMLWLSACQCLRVCVCMLFMCVSVCVRNHMITHLVDNSPYIHIYLYKHHCSHHSQQYRMPSKSAESISAWVAVCQLFSLLQVSNLWKHLSASPTEQWRTHWVFRHCSPRTQPDPILLPV